MMVFLSQSDTEAAGPDFDLFIFYLALVFLLIDDDDSMLVCTEAWHHYHYFASRPKNTFLKNKFKKILFFKITYSIFSNISNTCSFTLSSLSDGDVHRPGDEGCA